MEKFVKDSLMNHMESNQLFTNGQHGFRKGMSCITQLIEVSLSEILDAFDQIPMTLFLSTFLGVLVLFGYRILLFQVFDQFLVGILECLE
jgi:hypothetical protein